MSARRRLHGAAEHL